MTTPPRGLDAGIFRGRKKGQAYWEDFFRPYEAVTTEPVESSKAGTSSWSSSRLGRDPRAAAPRSSWVPDTCGRSETAPLCPCESSPSARRPSKPPGCGSRRCRRRTWRSSWRSMTPWFEVAEGFQKLTGPAYLALWVRLPAAAQGLRRLWPQGQPLRLLLASELQGAVLAHAPLRRRGSRGRAHRHRP